MAQLKNTSINDTGFLRLPNGTTSQRPVSPSTGMIRYNTDRGVIEYWNGVSWINSFAFDGTTSSRAAVSPLAIKNILGSVSGTYFLKPPGATAPVSAYIDMTSQPFPFIKYFTDLGSTSTPVIQFFEGNSSNNGSGAFTGTFNNVSYSNQSGPMGTLSALIGATETENIRYGDQSVLTTLPITWSVWAKPTTSSGFGMRLRLYGYNHFLAINSGTRWTNSYSFNSANDTISLTYDSPVSYTNEWVHTVFIKTASSLKIYVNGTLANSTTFSERSLFYVSDGAGPTWGWDGAGSGSYGDDTYIDSCYAISSDLTDDMVRCLYYQHNAT
jgi:hypothetical protein